MLAGGLVTATAVTFGTISIDELSIYGNNCLVTSILLPPLGTIGMGANCLMNDDDAVHSCAEAYISSVAWGDVEMTAEFARELRQVAFNGHLTEI